MDIGFKRMLPRLFGSRPRLASDETGVKHERSPAADVGETDREHLAGAELPSVTEPDIHVTANGGVLAVHVPKTTSGRHAPIELKAQ